MKNNRPRLARTAIAVLLVVAFLAVDATASPHHRRRRGRHHGGGGWWWSWWWGWNNQQNNDPTDTPEIDPALAGGAFMVLVGGVLIVGDSVRRKKKALPAE